MSALLEAGTVIAGRYRLVRPVTLRGLVAMWEAEQIALATPVSIKFLRETGPIDGALSQSFLRDARIAASVKHRNVLDVLDFGFTEARPRTSEGDASSLPYLVMELLRGRTLGALLEVETRLSYPRAIEIVAGTLRGVAAMHDAGLLHLDIKPHNVFMVEDEDGAFPELADFGLSARTGRTSLIPDPMLLATPRYLAPEQAAGRADLDGRADLYAVGVVLYEILAGRPPFPPGSFEETMDLVLHGAPTPLAEVAPHVPAAVVRVVETAMAHRREDRFVDARAMRAALLEPASEPRLPVRIDVHAPTLAAIPVPRAPATPPPTARASTPEPEPPAHARTSPSSSTSVGWVFARALVLAVITLGVAVLVLDGPWHAASPTVEGPQAMLGASDAGGLAFGLVSFAPDAALAADASAPDSGVDADVDAALDAALDAVADAAVSVDAALSVDAASTLADSAVEPSGDAGESLEVEDASVGTVPEVIAERPDAGRVRATPRRQTTRRSPPRRHPPRRSSRTHRRRGR